MLDNKVMTTTGDKINIEGNPVETTSYDSSGDIITGYELSSIITINIDGKEIQSCGDTCIFEQKGLNAKLIFSRKISTAIQMAALQTIHILPVS